MNPIIEYFDRVKADEDLKEKTKTYIREKIALENGRSTNLSKSPYSAKAGKCTLKRLAYAALPVAACLTILIGGYAYYQSPVNYISMDINPSVELGLNRFDRVVEVEGINAEGNSLLDGIHIMNLPADDAIEMLALEAEEKGFIRADGSTVIAVTSFSDQKEDAAKLREQMDEALRLMASGGALHAMIYTDCADLTLRTEARELGFSPGKYKLILLIKSLDSAVEIEQYRNVRITDLLEKANDLLKQKEGNTGTERNTEQERNREQSPSDLVQEPEQDRNRSDNQIQAISPNGQTTDQQQGPTQNQSEGQSRETSSPAIKAEPEQTDDNAQNQMPNQPGEGHEQLNRPETESDDQQVGNQNSSQPPGNREEVKTINKN